VAGLALRDGGLTIDLTPMRGVLVDPAERIAYAGGGCLLGDVDTATQAHGLMCPAGVVSHTGLGGLALGGGVGWTCRHLGLTCDNVVGADVVLADGSMLHAAPEENPELLWALRGGGGNFGVVTTFALRLHALRDLLFGQAVFPLDQAARAIGHYRDFMAAAPDELTSVLVLRVAPPLPVVPADLVGRPVAVINAAWSGDLATGRRVLRELTGCRGTAASRSARVSYLQLQTMQDGMHPHGLRNYMKSRYLDALTGDAIDALATAAGSLPGPLSQIEVVRLGGAVSRVAETATAFANRQAPYILNVVATWQGVAETRAHVDWASTTYNGLACAGTDAGYVNFLDDEPDRVRSVYSEATYARLQALKAELDPDSVFRGNVAIEPAARPAARFHH
jgi:FAD/FMN-containing dehydrogenase